MSDTEATSPETSPETPAQAEQPSPGTEHAEKDASSHAATPEISESEEYFDDDYLESKKKPPRIKDLLTSSDLPSRLVTYMSVIFAGLSLICIGLLTYVIISNHRARVQLSNADLDHQKLLMEPLITEQLGHFQNVLKAEPGQKRDFDLRVDLVAECSSHDACGILKSKLVEARDLINPILSSVTREELLTQEGKNRIRRRIAEQLNGIIGKGKVDEVRFTNMTIESGRGN